MSATTGLSKAPSTQSTPVDGIEIKNDPSIEVASTSADSADEGQNLVVVPLSFKLASIVIVSMIGFGSSWSGGITGAMKTTIKKVHL
jgi:hypothetical protein